MTLKRAQGAVLVVLGVLAFAIAGCSSSKPVAAPKHTTTLAPPTTVGPPLPPGTPPSGSVIVSAIRAAISRQAGVHVVGSSKTIKTGAVTTFVDDLGIRTGVERLASGGARFELRVTLTRAYIYGNAAGLQQFFGAPPQSASSIIPSWYYVKSSDPEFKSLGNAAKLGSLANSYLPDKQVVAVANGTFNGKPVYVLTWNQTPTKGSIAVTLYVPKNGAPLPIRETAASATISQIVDFSKWNESVPVAIPSGSVPISYMFGPPGSQP
jgi:hypothetical protein